MARDLLQRRRHLRKISQKFYEIKWQIVVAINCKQSADLCMLQSYEIKGQYEKITKQLLELKIQLLLKPLGKSKTFSYELKPSIRLIYNA